MSGFVPPAPPVPDAALSPRALLAALRTNTLLIWPRAAYRQENLTQRFFGRSRALLNQPAAIQHVLVTNAANYRRSPASIRILRPIVGGGLLLAEGEAWRHQRRTIAPALAPRAIPVLAGHVVAAAEQARLRPGPVDLLAAMQGLALEIAARSMFSLPMGLSAELGAQGLALRTLIGRFGERMARPGLLDMVLPASLPAPGDLRRWWFRRRWVRLIDAIVADRLAAPPPDAPRDLLDLLRAAVDPQTGARFDHQALRDQVATLIVAGHETTAVALFWSLFLLANAPAAQERAAAEAAGPELSAATLPRLVFIRAVVDEALRLYPPAFVVVREAIAADRAGDAVIDRGCVAMIAPWVLHRHHLLWEAPEMFVPERFLPGAPAPPRFAYLPFGAGPRVCVGAQFALAEATLVLASLLRRFRVALDDPRPVLPVGVVTTQPDHPARFVLQARH